MQNGKKLIVVMLLACGYMIIGGIVMPTMQGQTTDISSFVPSFVESTQDALVTVGDDREDPASLYWEALTDDEKVLYKDIVSACESFNSMVPANLLSDDAIERTMFAVQKDHPEFYFISSYSHWKESGMNKAITYTIPVDAKQMLEQLKAVGDGIVKDAPADPYEKVKYFYEYLVNTVDYDIDSEDNQYPQSALLNHKSVCAGYTGAFQYLCNLSEIPCCSVSGEVNGEGHAWNYVILNGNSYWVDVTWGDPVYFGETSFQEPVHYDYLCASDAAIAGRMINTHGFPMPSCTDDSLNYYRVIGTYLEDCNKENLFNMILSHSVGTEYVKIRCANNDILSWARGILAEDRYELNQILGENSGYTVSAKQVWYLDQLNNLYITFE